MKKKIITLIALSSILSFNSCSDFLDTEPTSITLETYFNNEFELNTFLNGVYDPMNSTNFYSSNYQMIMAQSTDESYNRSGVTGSTVGTYTALPSNTDLSNFWNTLYVGINRANTLLENIDKVPDLTPERKNIFLGETRFLRAYYLFIATQCFGDVPLRTNSVTTPADTHIAFTTQKEVYDFVIAEMTAAEQLLSKQTPTTIVPYQSGRVTNTTVQGILARACLYAAGNPINDTKRYAEAKTWAQKVITSGFHKLNPNYEQVFINHSQDLYDVANKESMWEVEFHADPSNSDLREGMNANAMLVPQYNGITPSMGKGLCQVLGTAILYRSYQSYYNSIVSTDLSPDKRRDINLAPWSYTGGNATTDAIKRDVAWNAWWGRWPGKWKRENELIAFNNQSSQNWPIIRYADVMLMYAEADNEVNGPTVESINLVNQIRSRAYGTLSATNSIELTITSGGSGYTIAPTEITTIGGTSTQKATIGTTLVGGAVTTLTMSNPGAYATLPSTIYLGTQWEANKTFITNSNVVNPSNGLLYRVTTAGVSTSVAPTHTSGASTAASTGAAFTYVGVAAQATAVKVTGILSSAQTASKEEFKKVIQDERMRELCYEAVRKRDLIRWGLLVSKVKEMGDLANNGSLERFPNNVQMIIAAPTSSSFRVIAANSGLNISEKWNLLPIPLDEISNNRFSKQNIGFQ
ncbi:RagB/SusD family nutrient uptake outer membrane protein [Flavobacterium algicola]|uniref:RagB/SusD family nutrient uptake outer membrane protein n=1 Tax=Flavobacterium algicola TaxID=556529 RepID=UPI001EFDB05D|nr:RagB/SusD family nutrient uptake outer membrane protein [Flavobacterium algicola]MCG9793083.1 RagB/SusD family nutrient uptake outer membrane protein [Flavobacterium algicola]